MAVNPFEVCGIGKGFGSVGKYIIGVALALVAFQQAAGWARQRRKNDAPDNADLGCDGAHPDFSFVKGEASHALSFLRSSASSHLNPNQAHPNGENNN
jgi:hypothetical protein